MPKVLEIMMEGNPVLRRISKMCRLMRFQNRNIQELIDDMLETCRRTTAVGLAAPQVNQSLQIAVIVSKRPVAAYPDAPIVDPFPVINPIVIAASDEIVTGWEGCMSVKNERGYPRGMMERRKSIDVEFHDRHGVKQTMKLVGFPARIFQHEFDHL